MLGSFTAGPTTLAKDQDWQAVLMGAGGLLGGVSAHLHNDAGSRSVKTVRDATFTCLNVRHAPSCFSDNAHRHVHAPDLSARNGVIDACAAHFDSLVRRFQAADSAVSDARRAEVAKHSRNWHAVPLQRRTGAVFQSLHVIALPLDLTMLANRTSVGTRSKPAHFAVLESSDTPPVVVC